MRRTLFTLTILLPLAACGPAQAPARFAAEIVTRQGGIFIVADPQAFYLRVCESGEYPNGGDGDITGLRAIASNRASTSGDEIAWSAISAIEFAPNANEPDDQLDDTFCSGLPQSIAALIRLRDGTTRKARLIDTTDRGIDGTSAQGSIEIAIRDIASLKMVEHQHWSWAAQDRHDKPVKVAITQTRTEASGEMGTVTKATTDPQTSIGYEKDYGGRLRLAVPTVDVSGFPAMINGARIVIPWNLLRQVDISLASGAEKLPPGAAPVTAHLIYADGHREEAGVKDGDIENLPIDSITKIEIKS